VDQAAALNKALPPHYQGVVLETILKKHLKIEKY
jgi:hypothetical protein